MLVSRLRNLHKKPLTDDLRRELTLGIFKDMVLLKPKLVKDGCDLGFQFNPCDDKEIVERVILTALLLEKANEFCSDTAKALTFALTQGSELAGQAEVALSKKNLERMILNTYFGDDYLQFIIRYYEKNEKIFQSTPLHALMNTLLSHVDADADGGICLIGAIIKKRGIEFTVDEEDKTITFNEDGRDFTFKLWSYGKIFVTQFLQLQADIELENRASAPRPR